MVALDELYRRYSQDVFRFTFWLSGDRSEAEDITSETFVRAWAGAEDLRASTVKAYLIVIARNLFLQRRRKSQRHRPRPRSIAFGREGQSASRAHQAGAPRQRRGEEAMNVTRDVVIDLLTLVLADEASEDSKALVASDLEGDPELARIAESRAARLTSKDVPAPPAKEVELRSLQRTKRLLSWRSALLAMGVFFALFPISFGFGSGGPHWLLLESPVSGAISAGIALVAWGGYFWIRRRLRARVA